MTATIRKDTNNLGSLLTLVQRRHLLAAFLFLRSPTERNVVLAGTTPKKKKNELIPSVFPEFLEGERELPEHS